MTPSPTSRYTLTSETSIPNGNTFLYNTGPITSLNDGDWNMKQKVTITRAGREAAPRPSLVNKMLTTPSNIGKKSTPNYTTLENAAIRTVGSGANQMKIYAGQTDDAFWVDLQVFDLLTLRGQDAPIGYTGGNNRPQDSVSASTSTRSSSRSRSRASSRAASPCSACGPRRLATAARSRASACRSSTRS